MVAQRNQFFDPSNLERGLILSGIQADYLIDKKLGSGKRGNTYLATAQTPRPLENCAFGAVKKAQPVVIKTVNLSEEWPLVEIVEYVSRVNRSLQRELFVLAKLKGLNCAAQVYDYHHFSSMIGTDFFVHPMFIVQGYVPGETLDKFVLSRWGQDFTGIQSADEWFHLASLIATNLIAVHQREVVHRDIWPPNIMIKAGEKIESVKLSFIDFGDAVLRHELAARDPFSHEHPYKAPERTNDWLWPTRRGDIYAVGGVLYFLAVGEHPPMPIENKDKLKHTVIDKLHKQNPGLLKRNQGVADIIARCLRYDPTERIRDADDLLHEIDVFRSVMRKEGNDRDKELQHALASITKQVEALSQQHKGGVDLFSAIAAQDLRLVAHCMESMTHGVRDISGDHEEIVAGLTRFLSALGPRDEYLAISTPKFWATENLGLNGRFLTMNKLVSERGTKIRRLFLVTEAELNATSDADNGNGTASPTFRQVAEAHLEVQRALPNDKKVDLRYLVVSKELREEFLRNDVHKGAWISSTSAVTIVPVYDRRDRIRAVRMRQYEGKSDVLKADLSRLIDRGMPLDESKGLSNATISSRS